MFVRFGNTTINLERVTYIEEGTFEMQSGEPGSPFIRFNFGVDDCVGFSKTSWNGKENPEYPIVKAWLDHIEQLVQ